MSVNCSCNQRAGIAGAVVAAIVFAINYKLTGRPDPLTALGIGIIAGLAFRVWGCFLAPDQPPAQSE